MTISMLETLFPSLNREAFLRDHWRGGRYLVTHGAIDRLSAVAEIPELRDVDTALHAYKGPITVYGEAIIDETEGLANRMIVAASQGRRRYDQGCTLELDGAEAHIPALRTHLEKLSDELELPKGTFAKAIVYASPRRSGLGAHFDAYVNFIVQLRGIKAWYLAENRNVNAPLSHYDLNEQPFVPEELETYWRGEAPRDYRAEAERVDLRPGSVLFLPRGYWHSTEAEEEVLSVNMTFSVPTWMELLLSELRRKLVRHERWRELADRAGSADPGVQAELRQHVAQLLATLATDLGTLDAGDVVARQSDLHDVYQMANALFRQGLVL
jgi:50S ribosomal protein L16 3-hydroxylase